MRESFEERRGSKERIGFWLGLFGFGLMLLCTEQGWLVFAHGESSHNPGVGRMIAVAWLMAAWWMSEAVPIPVTSLLPVVLLPWLGILSGKAVARQYMNEVIFLFMGGFFLALGLQKWGLHRRFALLIVSRLGDRLIWLLLGFMGVSGFLSMWISNTATTMMLLPIALSVVAFYEERSPQKGGALGTALMLGIAYSASVGGIATLVGTPPNLSFARIFQIYFPDAPEVSFVEWLKIGLPISLVMLPTIWCVLTFVFRDVFWSPKDEGSHEDEEVQREVQELFQAQLRELGPMRWQEWVVLSVFVATACLWLGRTDIRLGESVRIPGWVTLLGLQSETKRVRYVPWKEAMRQAKQKAHKAGTKSLLPPQKDVFWEWKRGKFLPIQQALKAPWFAASAKERIRETWSNALSRSTRPTTTSRPSPLAAHPMGTSKQGRATLPLYVKRVEVRKKTRFGDGVVAMMMALLLFLLPAGTPGERLLDWKTAVGIPWGMLLLFGGGFALAMGIKASGTSQWVGSLFGWQGFSSMGALGIILCICLVITFLTEFTSNTATTEIMLAIVAPVALTFGGSGVHPYLLMIPVTVAASCAFMMPVATPPNAIAYASGYVPMGKMVRIGLILNVLGVFVVSGLLYLVLQWLEIPLLTSPIWAK